MPRETPKAPSTVRPGRFPARPGSAPAATPAPVKAPTPCGRPPARHPVVAPAVPAAPKSALFGRPAEDQQPDERDLSEAKVLTPEGIAEGLKRRLLDGEMPVMSIGVGDLWADSFECEALTAAEEIRFRSWAESQIEDMRPGEKNRRLYWDQMPVPWSTPDSKWRMSA